LCKMDKVVNRLCGALPSSILLKHVEWTWTRWDTAFSSMRNATLLCGTVEQSSFIARSQG
jgi:hypothetical protein